MVYNSCQLKKDIIFTFDHYMTTDLTVLVLIIDVNYKEDRNHFSGSSAFLLRRCV